MKKLFVLFLMIAVTSAVLFNACKGGSAKKKSLNGFEVSMLKDEAGDLAKEGDYVYFRYYVKSKDSLIFASNMQTPVIKFKLPKIEKTDIKNAQPITDALHMMSKGDSIIVSQTLDDNMKKSIGIPGIDVLDFHVVLVDIKDEAGYNADMEADKKASEEKALESKGKADEIAEKAKQILADYKAKKLDDKMVTTASGLKYYVHEAGTGPKAENGKRVSVNYYGMLMDGKHFDDSWSRGQEFTFGLGAGQVIKGWDEGVANLTEGTKATLFIPSALGYGAQGSPPVIPENSDLMFYIEVGKVNQ
ncbi:MAG TPA: FKBP-type peptidyl-prolyl cis-trans isomerase [Saprospiraceae bacterium]|nr:FKBP-type peptidyl-prolyl cis-trans isomerase [Saprospiraceae bacterium]